MRARLTHWRPWFLVYAMLFAVAVQPAETQTNPLKVNLAQMGGSALAKGQTTMAGSMPVAIASNQSALPVTGTFWQATQPVSGAFFQATQPTSTADGGSVALGTTTDAAAADATGTAVAHLRSIAKNAALGATAAKQPALGTAGTAASDVVTVQGIASMTPLLVAPQASTTGGATPYFYPSSGAANQDATVLKGSAGQLYSFTAYNTTTSQRYVWLYNAASGVTSASTVVYCLALPANATGSGAVVSIPVGMYFSTGISFRITTGAPGSNTGAASTNDVIISAASF